MAGLVLALAVICVIVLSPPNASGAALFQLQKSQMFLGSLGKLRHLLQCSWPRFKGRLARFAPVLSCPGAFLNMCAGLRLLQQAGIALRIGAIGQHEVVQVLQRDFAWIEKRWRAAESLAYCTSPIAASSTRKMSSKGNFSPGGWCFIWTPVPTTATAATALATATR